MLLKTNLHFHTNENKDPKAVRYTFYQGIDVAAKLGFRVIGLTCFQHYAYRSVYGQYARQRGITVIPGIEQVIEKTHVIILNCNQDIENVSTFAELRKYKQKYPQIFILAPQPFFGIFNKLFGCLGKKLIQYIDLFDAIEWSWYYTKQINFNKRARQVAQQYNLPLIATSDTHFLEHLNLSYTIVDSPSQEIDDILSSIKEKKIANVSQPISYLTAINFWIKAYSNYKRKI